jgi:hypothetical protein
MEETNRMAARCVSRILTMVTTLVSMTAAFGANPPEKGKTRADEFQEYSRREIATFSIRLIPGERPLTMHPTPVLKWSNPLHGEVYGDVYIWTAKGRPEVIGSLYKWYRPYHHTSIEFHSLSAGLLVMERQGQPIWTPSRPGIELKPIPGAPEPSATPALRLRQMRELAGQFTGREQRRNDNGLERDTRLLTQPIYRYNGAEAPLVDGAVFGFVQGTDPETFLLIEARQAGEKARWEFGLTRMNGDAMSVSHRGKEVWSVPQLPWEQIRDIREPYMSNQIAY